MEMLHRTYGIGEPVKRMMELRVVDEATWRPGCLGGSAGVARDVLMGRDTEIGWEDVFGRERVAGGSAGWEEIVGVPEVGGR